MIAGDGELRPQLEEQVRARGLGSRIHFLGWRADLRPICGDLDVVAPTSLNEGTPVSVLEAQTAARPIVATAVGGVPDVLGEDRGVLVPPRDPERVARAVLDLLARQPRPRVSARRDVLTSTPRTTRRR